MAGEGVSHGLDAQLWVAPAGAAAPAIEGDWTLVALATDIAWGQQRGEVESTTRADGTSDAFLPGHVNRTADFTVGYDEASDDQTILLDSLDDAEIIWFRYRPKGTGIGKPERIFKGFVTNAPVTTPLKDKATMAVTVRVSGAPTRQLQAA